GKLIPSEAKRANLAAICEQILNHELIGNVRNYDLTDDKNIKFRLDNIEVQLGDNSRMEYKFMMLMEIYEGLLPNIKGELDLRNGSKAYFKEIYQ
ncbi:MAG: cell division protein FtsQ/DivIB, partial [Oscillospiraceae bacterium]|nr:cell division protein FtsQ/DivIB [Oscillospiraceae bacterium]